MLVVQAGDELVLAVGDEGGEIDAILDPLHQRLARVAEPIACLLEELTPRTLRRVFAILDAAAGEGPSSVVNPAAHEDTAMRASNNHPCRLDDVGVRHSLPRLPDRLPTISVVDGGDLPARTGHVLYETRTPKKFREPRAGVVAPVASDQRPIRGQIVD